MLHLINIFYILPALDDDEEEGGAADEDDDDDDDYLERFFDDILGG